MNQAFIDLLEQAKLVALRANTSPKLSPGDMCIEARHIKALEQAATKAQQSLPKPENPTSHLMSEE